MGWGRRGGHFLHICVLFCTLYKRVSFAFLSLWTSRSSRPQGMSLGTLGTRVQCALQCPAALPPTSVAISTYDTHNNRSWKSHMQLLQRLSTPDGPREPCPLGRGRSCPDTGGHTAGYGQTGAGDTVRPKARCRLARGWQALVEGLEHRIVPDRCARRAIEDMPNLDASVYYGRLTLLIVRKRRCSRLVCRRYETQDVLLAEAPENSRS
jgi:hypothetical protein